MELDTQIEELLKEILHFLEFMLKDVFFPASVLEEKFRLSTKVARVLQKKAESSFVDKPKTLSESFTYVSVESSINSFGPDEETILRSGHRHRNGMFLDPPVSELNRSGSEPRSDSGCPDTVSQFSDETLESKRVSLSSTSSSESNVTRREDDSTSIRSSVSNVQLTHACEALLPTYEEAELRAFFTGAIKKKFAIVRGWKTYAGVIYDGKLLLYCASKTGTPKHIIALDSYEVRAASVSKKKNNFEFVIVGAGKQTYKFRTETEEDLSSWIRSLEAAVRSITIDGVTEDETSDLPEQEDSVNRSSTVDNLFFDNIKFDLLADMKKLEEYEIAKKAEQPKSIESREGDEQRNSAIFETRNLPSIPSEEFYDDVVNNELRDENIYDMPSRARKEEIYDVPVSLDASRRSSSGTVYDSPEELVYEAPNISFDPSELYDVPKFSYDPPTPSVETKPPLSAKTRSPKRSESLNEACYNVPRCIYEAEVYDQPKPLLPKCDKGRNEEAVEVKKIENKEVKSEIKTKLPRQFSFSGSSNLFKDELELKLRKQRDNDTTGKTKKDFMNRLLDEAPEEGRFFAYPVIIEPSSPVSPPLQPKRQASPSVIKQSSPLADVFANARNVFLQKAEQGKKTPPRLKLDLDNVPPSARLSPGENKKSAPPTPTKPVPPRPPAPNFRDDLKEIKKEKSPTPGRTPPPPLVPPLEEIYEDIDQGEYAEPEIYIARWAYIATTEKELSLRKGETVYVISKNSKDSWLCKTSKSQGFVPCAYLAKVS